MNSPPLSPRNKAGLPSQLTRHPAKRLGLLPMVICLVFPLAAFSQLKFNAEVDKTRLALDEHLTLRITATGKDVTRNMPAPVVGKLKHFRIVDRRSSMSSTSSMRIIINGRDMSTEKTMTWTYVLAPKKQGNLLLPAFVLNHNGKAYKTRSANIHVTKESPQSRDVLFQVIPEKRSVYVGEQFRCVFRIAIRDGANAYNPKRPNLEEALRKSFWVEPLTQGEIKPQRRNIKGAAYNVFDIPLALYPIQAGKAKIPSMVLPYEQRQAVQRRSPFNDPFLGGFFGSSVRTTPKQKASRPVSITVHPLPPAPAHYSGSVGRFSLSAKTDKSSVPAGDALTLTLLLRGSSSLRSVKDPVLPPMNGFEVFDPEKKTRAQTGGNRIWGIREYKYVLIPQRQGDFRLAPITYVYFDTDTKSYRTVKTTPIHVTVTPGKARPAVSGTRRMLTQSEIKQVGQDIRFIKTEAGEITRAAGALHRNLAFLGIQFLPLLLVSMSFLVQHQQRKRSRDHGYARRSLSKRRLRRQLAESRTALKNGQPGSFYAALTKGILGYIGDSLNVEAQGMTTTQIRSLLEDKDHPREQVQAVIEQLEKADFGRFAVSSISAEEMKSDLGNTEQLLSRMRL